MIKLAIVFLFFTTETKSTEISGIFSLNRCYAWYGLPLLKWIRSKGGVPRRAVPHLLLVHVCCLSCPINDGIDSCPTEVIVSVLTRAAVVRLALAAADPLMLRSSGTTIQRILAEILTKTSPSSAAHPDENSEHVQTATKTYLF